MDDLPINIYKQSSTKKWGIVHIYVSLEEGHELIQMKLAATSHQPIVTNQEKLSTLVSSKDLQPYSIPRDNKKSRGDMLKSLRDFRLKTSAKGRRPRFLSGQVQQHRDGMVSICTNKEKTQGFNLMFSFIDFHSAACCPLCSYSEETAWSRLWTARSHQDLTFAPEAPVECSACH